MEEVKEHLSVYFKKAQDLIKSDYNLCLLCIQCLEVPLLNDYCLSIVYLGFNLQATWANFPTDEDRKSSHFS